MPAMSPLAMMVANPNFFMGSFFLLLLAVRAVPKVAVLQFLSASWEAAFPAGLMLQTGW